MNIILKRSLAFILSFMIVFSSTSVLAASPAGWATSPADVVINGVQATITAVKGTGSNALKSVITHAPTPATIGKNLLKGTGSVAIAFAVVELTDGAIDWVLDPANNTVKYKPVASAGGNDALNPPAGYPMGTVFAVNNTCSFAAYSPEQSCKIASSYWGGTGLIVPENKRCSTGEGFYTVYVKNNCTVAPAPSAPPAGVDSSGYKAIPMNNIAAKVISNANTGHAPSQDVIKAAAIDSVNAGALDTELQASAVPNVGTTNPDGTVTNPDGTVTNPDGTVTDTPIPFDPSSIISAIQSLGSMLGAKFTSITDVIGITNTKLDDIADANAKAAKDAKDATDAKAAKDAEFKDWATAEPIPLDPDTTLDLDVPNILPVDTDINFGGSCPANFEVNSSIFGNPINIVLLDSSKFCGFLSTFVKFPVYAVSSLFALYILGGRKDV